MTEGLLRHSFLLPLLCIGLGAASSAALAQRQLLVSPSRVDSIVEAHRVKHHVPSISLFIGTTGGRSLYEKSYGMARMSPSAPATTNTLFLLASISKPYAAVVAHRLAELQRIDLAAPTSHYLPDLPRWSDSVSIRQLLSHSSGILDFTDVPGWNDTANADDYTARALAAPLRFHPGTRIEYSNTNYALVQRIIETVSGVSYSAVATRLVLAPLGLDHTHFDCPASWSAELAQGYRSGSGDSVISVLPPARGQLPDAAAGLCATSRDVARFLSSILAGRLLHKSSVDDLHTVEGEAAEELGFGAGLSVAREATGEVWAHGGALRGANTEAAVWPKDSLVVVVLTNLGGSEAEELNRQVARSVLALPRPPVLDLPLQPGASGRYAGRYNTYNGRIIVGERDGRVYAVGGRCYYQGGDVFVCDPDKSRTIRFVGDSIGIREAWLIVEGVRRLRGVRARP